MKVARSIEILAWTVGVSLLVTYAAGRSWFAYGREQGIESFDALQPASGCALASVTPPCVAQRV